MLLEMGALTSRQNIGVEEVDIPSSSVYRYPPKSGKSGTTGRAAEPNHGPDSLTSSAVSN